jgi:hypothetical protein
MILTSFHTNEFYYNVYQKYLKQGIKRHKYFVHLYENRVVYGEQYLKALELKPHYIIQTYTLYKEKKEPLLYLDVDCEILRPLNNLEKLISEVDIAYRRYPSGHINCAVLGFSYNNFDKVLLFLYEWHHLTLNHGKEFSTVDQPNFEKLVKENKYGLKFLELEAIYNVISHDKEQTQIDCVIYHRKVAREFYNTHARVWRKKFLEKKPDEDKHE